ncbi:unnamed protein product [Symbiodinium natans]|uniref:Uncharacterized protein n=1 Tax=Symbiodinium natans TaxID=878477 RepID=A0A812JW46_9DINO|nr:unnamed protein product [Symbiodinium natans]
MTRTKSRLQIEGCLAASLAFRRSCALDQDLYQPYEAHAEQAYLAKEAERAERAEKKRLAGERKSNREAEDAAKPSASSASEIVVAVSVPGRVWRESPEVAQAEEDFICFKKSEKESQEVPW